MSTKKRPQAPKPRMKAFNDAMQEVRRSSASQPHKNKSKYNRRSKYGRFGMGGDDE